MAAPLCFIYVPTDDLAASLALYRDQLGYEELWREGDDTVGLAIPGGEAALMLDRVVGDDRAGQGPMFLVDDVTAFVAEHPELEPAIGPMAIPDGALVGYRDPSGNWFYVLDQSGATEA